MVRVNWVNVFVCYVLKESSIIVPVLNPSIKNVVEHYKTD